MQRFVSCPDVRWGDPRHIHRLRPAPARPSAAARGFVTQTAEAYDYDNNGVPDTVYGGATQYNAKGQVLEARFFGDYDNDGTADYTVVNSFRYDAGNKLVGKTSTDVDSDGFATQAVSTYTNDVRGNPTSGRFTVDYGLDGSIDQVGTAVATFDSRATN